MREKLVLGVRILGVDEAFLSFKLALYVAHVLFKVLAVRFFAF